VHIGVIEDTPLILDCICAALELGGHTVGAYPDGAELLEALLGALPTVCFDLLITDLDLPGPLSGEDIIVRLWADSRYAQLPVVVVTAAPDQRIASVLARFPGLSVVRKPFHIDDLLRSVAGARPVGMGG
jgi:two-component system OmpR family response regulator